jgi:hypothetical protein
MCSPNFRGVNFKKSGLLVVIIGQGFCWFLAESGLDVPPQLLAGDLRNLTRGKNTQGNNVQFGQMMNTTKQSKRIERKSEQKKIPRP